MIDTLVGLGIPLVLGAFASTLTYVLGRKCGRDTASADAAVEHARIAAQRDAAEGRARIALGEASRYRAMSLAGNAALREPPYATRIAPGDAESLVALLRGLAFVDDAIVADERGLALTRESEPRAARVASLAAPLGAFARAMTTSGLPVAEIMIETFSAEHVCARPLMGRGGGTFLLVATTSRPASPLAIDAAVQAASRPGDSVPPIALLRGLRGTTETRSSSDATYAARVATELTREARSGARATMLVLDAEALHAVVEDGPHEAARAAACKALDALVRASARLLRASVGIARVTVTLRDGDHLGWAAVAPSSRLALVTFGVVDARAIERLVGRVRRALGDAIVGSESRAA